ncbi:MAG: TrkH family potassium uptake protein [Eubacteriales bacterium]|nr:TrkH family potassium uptake protein [Eubacteriales bacterium]
MSMRRNAGKNEIQWKLLADAPDSGSPVLRGWWLIAGYMGIVMILSGAITLLPLLTLIFYPEELRQAEYFIVPGVTSMLTGYLVSMVLRGRELGRLERNQEMVVVLGTWMTAIVITALPFVLTGDYTFTQAVFETTSGLSTTGLSVVDTATAPRIFLIHRTVLLFFGGIGLVLVMTSVLSDVYGMRLYDAEGHSDRMLPNLIQSARLIIGIYSGYILAGILLYVGAGMSLFDAVNHAVAALSTGGFATHPESIGYYHSPVIELITIVLMLLGCTNFFVHLLLIRGRFRDFFRHCETRMALGLLAVFVPVMTVLLLQGFCDSVPESLRVALFQAVSALTTTGFQTVDTFQDWSPALLLLMILLQLVGGSAGSTAGGLKLYRVCYLVREIRWNLMKRVCPDRLVFGGKLNRGGKSAVVPEEEKLEIHQFFFLYLMLFVLGTFVFCCYGYPVEASMFEFSSALSTVGLSMGITACDAAPLIHWTATAGMLLGRLEIYVVLVAAARLASDGKQMVTSGRLVPGKASGGI